MASGCTDLSQQAQVPFSASTPRYSRGVTTSCARIETIRRPGLIGQWRGGGNGDLCLCFFFPCLSLDASRLASSLLNAGPETNSVVGIDCARVRVRIALRQGREGVQRNNQGPGWTPGISLLRPPPGLHQGASLVVTVVGSSDSTKLRLGVMVPSPPSIALPSPSLVLSFGSAAVHGQAHGSVHE